MKKLKNNYLFCEFCNYKDVLPDLTKYKSRPGMSYQKHLPKVDKSTGKMDDGTYREQPSLYQCVNCGRWMRLRELNVKINEQTNNADGGQAGTPGRQIS